MRILMSASSLSSPCANEGESFLIEDDRHCTFYGPRQEACCKEPSLCSTNEDCEVKVVDNVDPNLIRSAVRELLKAM